MRSRKHGPKEKEGLSANGSLSEAIIEKYHGFGGSRKTAVFPIKARPIKGVQGTAATMSRWDSRILCLKCCGRIGSIFGTGRPQLLCFGEFILYQKIPGLSRPVTRMKQDWSCRIMRPLGINNALSALRYESMYFDHFQGFWDDFLETSELFPPLLPGWNRLL